MDTNTNPGKDEAAKAREELEKLMNEPISKLDANKRYTELDLQRTQLNAYIVSLRAQSAQIAADIAKAEINLANLDCESALVTRRLANEPEQ